MTSFKKNKNKEVPIVLPILENKLKDAIKIHQPCFYYPLLISEVNYVKKYFADKYHTIVEIDHQTEGTNVYKFYGYLN